MKKIVDTKKLLLSMNDLELGEMIVSEVISFYNCLDNCAFINLENYQEGKYYNVDIKHYSHELLKKIAQEFKKCDMHYILDVISYILDVKTDMDDATFIKMESIVYSVTYHENSVLWWNDFIKRFCICHSVKNVGDKLLKEEIPFSYDNNSLTILVDKLNSKKLNFNHIVISGGDIDFKLDFKVHANNHTILEEFVNSTCNFSNSTEDGFLNPAYYEELSEDVFSVEATVSFDYDTDGERVFNKLKEILAFDKK